LTIPSEKKHQNRFEFKYLVSEAQAASMMEQIRLHMRPDRYGQEGVYRVVSLYLDSEDLRLCRESLEGAKNRFKLRIRSYSDDQDQPRFVEIKRRMNRIIEKSRASIPADDLELLVADRLKPPSDGSERTKNLEQFLFYMRQIQAKPVIRVRYMRQAFESNLNDDARVTLDRQLCFNITRTPQLVFGGDGWQRPRESGVVLELKFTDRCPMWLNRMVQYFGLTAESLSKYASLVKQACGLRFCAPAEVKKNQDG